MSKHSAAPTQNELFYRSHVQGFPGIKSKYQRSKKDEMTGGKDVNSKTQVNELDKDSLDMGKQGSQQVYFEDEIKPALEGSRNAFPHQTDR